MGYLLSKSDFSTSPEYSGEYFLVLLILLFVLSTDSTSDPAVASIPDRSLQFLPQWTLMQRNWSASLWQPCTLSAICALDIGWPSWDFGASAEEGFSISFGSFFLTEFLPV